MKGYPGAERRIRVFLSSTFRDMQEERDYLLKFTFPQLRDICARRNVVWDAVDLRWGITDEQSRREQVLLLCLEEIQRCRPYFVGLLGERYGWIPAHIPDEIAALQPWLGEYGERSVTELEILHGVLRHPAMHEHGFFYFRDQRYLESLPADVDRRDFESESEASAAKLARLKQTIRQAAGRGVCKLREDYRAPEQLGEWLLADFTALIDELFPEGPPLTQLDRDAADHEAFARSRARVYLGREADDARLNAHAAGTSAPLVILGESGVGKSALLANWALTYRDLHPQEFVLMHFTGVTAGSADWAAMLRRLMGELKRHFNLEAEIPQQTDALPAAFANCMHMAAARGRTVLILDALNQLEDHEGALDLAWLPPEIPGNVRLFVSTLPGRPLEQLRRRGWPTLQVQPLDRAERRRLVIDYLAQRSKALDEPRIDRLADAPPCANPLYLRALLDELCNFGRHERLDERMAYYLEAATPAELCEKILTGWEQDYGSGTDLVRQSMTLLWAARRGLSESELLELLGGDQLPLPRLTWSYLYRAAEHSLMDRSGLLNFSHEYLREAVRLRYLPDELSRRAAHLRLARYFGEQQTWKWVKGVRLDVRFLDDGRVQITGKKEPNLRQADEQPWQLMQAAAWQELSGLLCDTEFLPVAWAQSRYDVQSYWVAMEASSEIRMVPTYRALTDPTGKEDGEGRDIAALLLSEFGHTQEALQLRSTLVEQYAVAGDGPRLQASLEHLSSLLMVVGDLDGALAANRKQEQICRESGDLRALASSLGAQGLILFERGDLDAALALHREHERISRQIHDAAGVGVSLNNQAVVLQQQRRLDEAMACFREEETLCRQLGDLNGVQHSLGGQAIVTQLSGHMDGVMALYKRQEAICRQLGNMTGLAVCIGNQATALLKLGNWNGALKLHREEERICRESGYRKGLAISLIHQAVVAEFRGDLDTALRLCTEGTAVWRELKNERGIADGLRLQLGFLLLLRRLPEALAVCREWESVVRPLDDPAALLECLGSLAATLLDLGRRAEAAPVLAEHERLSRELGDHRALAGSLTLQAGTFEGTADLEKGIALADRALQIATEHGYTEVARGVAAVRQHLLDKTPWRT